MFSFAFSPAWDRSPRLVPQDLAAALQAIAGFLVQLH
jgi:hypothetical protein